MFKKCKFSIYKKYNHLILSCCLSFSFFLTIMSLTSCRSVPYTDRTQLMLTSEDEEISMGEDSFRKIKATEKKSNDPEEIAAVNRVGENLSKAADKKNYKWEFLVLSSEDANAYCLPGGKIVVYSGLFKYAKNDGELATVLGHEIGHALARHTGERISQSYLEAIGGGALDIALIFIDVPPGVGSIYDAATELGLNLPYSRTQEYEADYIGLMLMAKAGYDPKTAIVFWDSFSKESNYGPVKEFFSTHPMGEKRLEELKKALPTAEELYLKQPVKLGVGNSIN